MELLNSDEVLFGAIYSDGHISLQDVPHECIKEKWIPLATYSVEGKSVLPLFKTAELARKFSKRNFPTQWIKGAVQLTQNNIQFLVNKKLNVEVFDYPKKMKDQVEFGFEVLEFEGQPSLGCHYTKEFKKL